MLLTLHLALCFFLSSGPRCAASWPLWTRRSLHWQWHVQGWYCWFLPFTLCSLLPFTGPDALHHGRYGPDVLGHGRSHARCVQRHLPMVQTALKCGVSAVAVFFCSSSSLSWRRCRFSWSSPQSFPSCSTLTRWLTFAVQVVACPSCATTLALVDDVRSSSTVWMSL